MKSQQRSVNAEQVKRVRARIQEWRGTRRRLSAMPEPLWKEAVSLGRRFGVGVAARGVGVDFGALKKRVETTTPVGRAGGFLELSGTALLGTPAVAGPVIEVSGANGAKLTIRLMGDALLDVKGLVEAFGGGQACSR